MVAALAVAMTLTGSPAEAGTTTISDPNGVDYYWGGEETDLSSVSLSGGGSRMVASWTVDGVLPPAGSTPPGGGTSFGYKALFQNQDKQTGHDNYAGGCSTPGGVRVPDVHGPWPDGFHFFIGFDVIWTGLMWEYRATVGEYDPSPGGGFRATDLASTFSDWSISTSGSTVTVEVESVVAVPNPACSGGVQHVAYMTSGDRVVNVKGLSTFGSGPIAVPVTGAGRTVCAVANELGLDCGSTAVTATVGGITHFSDVTIGNSTEGAYGTNLPNISWTPGVLGAVDTLGPGPRCPWPPVGGVLPPNPLHSSGSRCHIDDDVISRGSYLAEWWDTPYGFTA